MSLQLRNPLRRIEECYKKSNTIKGSDEWPL